MNQLDLAPLSLVELDGASGGLLSLPISLGAVSRGYSTPGYYDIDFGGYAPTAFSAYDVPYIEPAYGSVYGQPYVIEETIYEHPGYGYPFGYANNNPAGAMVNAFAGIAGMIANAVRR